MVPEKQFWDFLLNVNEPLKRSVYKKAILRGQLTILSMAVGVIYIIIDYINGIYFNVSFYGSLILFSGFTLFLNRGGHFKTANVVFLLLLNVLIYIFAANDIYRSGVYTYFIVCTLTAFTLCGYEHLKLGILFCALSILLFSLAYVFHYYPFVPRPQMPEAYVTIAFVVNFTVSIVTTTTLLFFLLEINFRAEAELVTNNELLSKTNKELDRFVYSASHDLRAPLSSILGLVELAKKSNNPEEIKMCLDLIADRINVQDSFIQDIIDYARNSRVTLSNERIELKSFVSEMVNQLMYNDEAKGINFRIEIDENTYINGDQARLTSVMSNLIGNAIKYHDTSKSDRFIRIGLVKAKDGIEIQVEDNGQGIHPNFHQKIFDMFFRASEASKGSGLGLFIVKETLEKMGGKVCLKSQVGKGSCFSVHLPNSIVSA